MSKVLTLSKRHIKSYLRDKAAVFFSFLSIIILLALYLLFLSDLIAPGSALPQAEATRFTLGYIFGGVMVVGCVSIPLGILSPYVADVESRRINNFMVLPIKRRDLTLSYFVSTFIVSLFFMLLMFSFVVLYMGIVAGLWLSLTEIMLGLAIILLYLFISVPIILFIITFIKTSGGFAGVSSTVGTLIGFISGIYIPLFVLDPITRNIAAVLPFSHMTIYLRKLLIGNDIIKNIPNEALNEAGIANLPILGQSVSYIAIFAIFSALSVVFLMLSYYKLNKKQAN